MAGHERLRSLLGWLTVLVAVLALGALVVIWRPEFGIVEPAATPTGSAPPVAPAPEQEPTLLPATDPTPVAEPVDPADAGTVDAAAVRRALAPGLADPRLGRHVVVRVADLAGGAAVFATGTAPVIPASTTKLLTTLAALELLGPDHVFTTRVVEGDRPGQIILVGGGDPYLQTRPSRRATQPPRADLRTLARETASALRASGRARVRLGYDDSLFSGPVAEPTWEPDYLTDDVVSPITALWVDEGRGPDGFHRVEDPSAYAASAFARALARQGITVQGRPTPRQAGSDATGLAEVDSPALAQIVERVLEVSDNEAAEVLGHQVGLAAGGEGSFAGGVAGVEQALRDLNVPLAGARLHDGSGLSRADRLDPRTLTEVLRVAGDPERPELRAVLTGLPVAGFTGSLSYRFSDGPAAGRGQVRAKTGTLTGVSGLAGLVTDRDGATMVFVLVADRVARPNTLAARDGLDRMAAALAACRCGR